MKRLPLSFLAALVLWAGASAAVAHDYRLGSLHIDHPWARASIGQVPNGAAYLVVTNEGTEPDRLVAAESDAAKRAALHTHLMEDGIMKMRPVEAVEIAPGEPAVLQPGGLHIMLMGLTQPLRLGDVFTLTLVFEKAGRIEMDVPVLDPATIETPSGEGHDHDS